MDKASSEKSVVGVPLTLGGAGKGEEKSSAYPLMKRAVKLPAVASVPASELWRFRRSKMRIMAGAECRDGCCEEGEWTSKKTKKVKLGRGCEEGE